MILLTGAGGKTGKAIIRALARRGARVRAWVREESRAGSLQALGADECVVGDMSDPARWNAATDGVDSIYHVAPNMFADELGIGRLALRSAGSAGIRHFVYHSVLHPQVELMPHHWQKLRMEEAIFESGMPFTILQPAPYMQNVLVGWNSIVQHGVYGVPYAVETRLSIVDLEDVAEAAAIVLTEPGHAGATYELCSLEALTQIEVAEVLSLSLRRSVRAEQIPRDEWKRKARSDGVEAYGVETLLAMFHYYEKYGLVGNGNVLRWLMGRHPRSFTDFVGHISTETHARS